MYTNDSILEMEFIILLVIIGCLYILFSIIMRKLFKVKRKDFFSYNHVNDTHKKIDFTIRTTTTIFIVVGFVINMNREPMEMYWYLQPWFLLIIFSIAIGIARIHMEWKYAENHNDYKYTISELVFILVLLLVLFSTDFMWLI